MIDYSALNPRVGILKRHTYERAEELLQLLISHLCKCSHGDDPSFVVLNSGCDEYKNIKFGALFDVFSDAEYELYLDCHGNLTITIENGPTEIPAFKVLQEVLKKNGFTPDKDIANCFNRNIFE